MKCHRVTANGIEEMRTEDPADRLARVVGRAASLLSTSACSGAGRFQQVTIFKTACRIWIFTCAIRIVLHAGRADHDDTLDLK
jgi:hypothetical protein